MLPWFIGAFLLASLARSYVPGIAGWSGEIARVARGGFVVVLFLIGMSLQPRVLKTVGWKTFAQGGLLWLLVAGGSLLAVLTRAR